MRQEKRNLLTMILARKGGPGPDSYENVENKMRGTTASKPPLVTIDFHQVREWMNDFVCPLSKRQDICSQYAHAPMIWSKHLVLFRNFAGRIFLVNNMNEVIPKFVFHSWNIYHGTSIIFKQQFSNKNMLLFHTRCQGLLLTEFGTVIMHCWGNGRGRVSSIVILRL